MSGSAEKHLENRTALVTGATGAIGGAVAVRLAQQGMKVWLAYSSRHAQAETLRQTIANAGGCCELVTFDVRDGEACRKQISSINRAGTPITVCVCCAGASQPSTLPATAPEEWEAAVSLHLAGFFHVTQPLLRDMMRSRAGAIVALGVSDALQTPWGGFAAYASKAGLLGAVRSLAREMGRFGVRVNLVTPGWIESSSPYPLDAGAGKERTELVPMRRMGTAEEVAEVIAFLASERAGYITGANIAVNGGLGG